MLRWLAQDLAERIARLNHPDPALERQLASVKREQQSDRDARPRKRAKRGTRA